MNNFDQSSSGINIDFCGLYSGDLSRMNFEENFELMYDHYVFYIGVPGIEGF